MKEELRDLTFYGHEYGQWLEDLKQRYLSQRMRATVAVNSALLEFYWSVGKDISENQKDGNTYGSKFYERLSQDLCADLPNVKGLSATNLKYTKYFYELYKQEDINRPQAVDDFEESYCFKYRGGINVILLISVRAIVTKLCSLLKLPCNIIGHVPFY